MKPLMGLRVEALGLWVRTASPDQASEYKASKCNLRDTVKPLAHVRAGIAPASHQPHTSVDDEPGQSFPQH